LLNIGNLLSTLLGGLLTIIGGFGGSYLLQSRTDKKEKQKEIRDMLESIFQDIQFILFYYARFKGYSLEETELGKKETQTRIFHLQTLIYLYLAPLHDNFKKFLDVYQEFLYEESQNTANKKNVNTDKLTAAASEFQASVVDLLKSKGYSYF